MKTWIAAITGVLVGVATGFGAARLGPVPQPESASASADLEDVLALTGTARGEVLAFARLLRNQPQLAIDFTHLETNPQYCLNDGANMLHIAAEPGSRIPLAFLHPAEDLVAAGLDVSRLPLEPDTPDALEPETWYYYPAGGRNEPLHGKPLGVPMLVRTSKLDPSPITGPAP